MNTVTDIIKSCKAANRSCISIEVFPPRGELTLDATHKIIDVAQSCRPDFVSVTSSAGGSGNAENTGAIASMVQTDFGMPSVAHMVCTHLDETSLKAQAASLKDAGINNVLALRGDLPDAPAKSAKQSTIDATANTGGSKDSAQKPLPYFKKAADIIPILSDAGFCVGAAAYPEGHPDCFDHKTNIEHTLAKQAAGANFFVTQLCFDNQAIYRFLDDAHAAGVTVPIVVGIMPFLSKAQLTRMVFMCGVSLPAAVVKLLNRFENDKDSLRSAGIDYACKQLDDLALHGVDGCHIYTMNHAEIAISAADTIRKTQVNAKTQM
jgi:methylenetetrahydrofolate reductase (NADPH)